MLMQGLLVSTLQHLVSKWYLTWQRPLNDL